MYFITAIAALVGMMAAASQQGTTGDTPPNTLSAAERAAGWRLLFDGKTLKGWRGFKQQKVPPAWQVQDGAIVRVADGPDLITVDQFDDFELALEWKLAEGGNSGIMFRVSEDAAATYHTGPELQILDDDRHRDGQDKTRTTGSNYALHAPATNAVKPIGSWNTVRLVVNGNRVTHWLNGEKIIEYDLGTPEWATLVAASKFKEWPNYGKIPKGHIALQQHGARVEFRNIKIKPL